MKKMFLFIPLLALSAAVFAVDHSRNGSSSPFTGDNVTFQKISVSSSTAATLSAYSTSRGALTCINSDTTNAVYIGSSTAVLAQGAAAFPLYPRTSVQYITNAGLFAIADTGVTSVTVYCSTEY